MVTPRKFRGVLFCLKIYNYNKQFFKAKILYINIGDLFGKNWRNIMSITKLGRIINTFKKGFKTFNKPVNNLACKITQKTFRMSRTQAKELNGLLASGAGLGITLNGVLENDPRLIFAGGGLAVGGLGGMLLAGFAGQLFKTFIIDKENERFEREMRQYEENLKVAPDGQLEKELEENFLEVKA